MLFQDKYTFKIQKQTTFKANMRENVIEFSISIKKSILIKINMHLVRYGDFL
jgi:hypothetical protein